MVLAVLAARLAAFGVDNVGVYAVSDADMKKVYEEVKTPYKHGMVIVPSKGEMVDDPVVFRHQGAWYMIISHYDGKGYDTLLVRSEDLLHWEIKGSVLPKGEPGKWDCGQAAGWPILIDTEWGGSNEIKSFGGKYWMMYIGGAGSGYEPDPLATGVAWTDDPIAVKSWTRFEGNPVLHPHDRDARAFEQTTIYRHHVVEDSSRKFGGHFVSFYNGKSVFRRTDGRFVNQERVGMAVSDDLLHWKRFGDGAVICDVLSNQRGISGQPVIQRIGDIWVAFYFGYGWRADCSGAWETFACSRDLEHWTRWKGEPLVKPSEPYDSRHAHKPWVIKHDGIVYHFYNAVGNQGRGIALATSRLLGPDAKGKLADVTIGFRAR